MKWDNKLHQCDGSKNELLYRFSQGVYIYGAGVIGIQLSNVLKKYGLCRGFIDNNIYKIDKYGFIADDVIMICKCQ